MPRRTKEDALVTRERLIDAAERCFAEIGAARTSMSAIANGACVSRGALYHHFQSKVEIVEAVRKRSELCGQARAADVEASAPTDMEALFASLRDFMERVQTDERLRRSLCVIASIDGIGGVDVPRALQASGAKKVIQDMLQSAGRRVGIFGELPPAAVGLLIDDVMQGCLRRLLEKPLQAPTAALQSLYLLFDVLKATAAICSTDRLAHQQ